MAFGLYVVFLPGVKFQSLCLNSDPSFPQILFIHFIGFSQEYFPLYTVYNNKAVIDIKQLSEIKSGTQAETSMSWAQTEGNQIGVKTSGSL